MRSRAMAAAGLCVMGTVPAVVSATERPARVAVFVQGEGVVLAERPMSIDAKRNVRPPSISGLDGWRVKRWVSWGGKSARATATYYWNSPSHADVKPYASRLVLDHTKACGQYRIYTRIRGTFTGKRPPGMPRTVALTAYRYSCPVR